MNKLTVGKDILAQWRSEASKSEGTYAPDSKTKALQITEFEVVDLNTRYGATKKVEFSVEGIDEPFSFFIKSGRTIDPEVPVKIQKYVAQKDYECTGGAVIKAGSTKWMATQ